MLPRKSIEPNLPCIPWALGCGQHTCTACSPWNRFLSRGGKRWCPRGNGKKRTLWLLPELGNNNWWGWRSEIRQIRRKKEWLREWRRKRSREEGEENVKEWWRWVMWCLLIIVARCDDDGSERDMVVYDHTHARKGNSILSLKFAKI